MEVRNAEGYRYWSDSSGDIVAGAMSGEASGVFLSLGYATLPGATFADACVVLDTHAQEISELKERIRKSFLDLYGAPIAPRHADAGAFEVAP